MAGVAHLAPHVPVNAKAAGRRRLKGISFTALPFSAMTLHWIMMYVLMYALTGVLHSDSN